MSDDIEERQIPYDKDEFPNGVLYLPYDIETVAIPLKFYLMLSCLAIFGAFSIFPWVMLIFGY